MGIAADMKKLGEDIVASYDMRVRAIEELVSDVQKTLKRFASGRKRMSKEQAKALADFARDLTNNVSNMIEGFQKERKAMANEIKKMAANWQSTAATMAKRRGIKPKVEAKGKGKT